MDENEILVDQTENVETETTEEISGGVEAPMPKTYTQEELDDIVGRRLARSKAKLAKEYERKYGELESVLRAGTGKESVEEITDTFKKHYEGRGVKFEEKPRYTDKEVDILAKAEAEDIIQGGLDEVVEETDRLVKKGVANMTPREKAMFKVLAEYRQNAERSRELSKIGVTESVYNSQEFKDFAAKFNSSTSIKDIYEIYEKTKPKKEYKTMGSMKTNNAEDNGVKEYYSPEEARKFTKSELDKNPALFNAIVKSMQKWK